MKSNMNSSSLTKQLYFNEGIYEFDYSGVATQSPPNLRLVNNTLEVQ